MTNKDYKEYLEKQLKLLSERSASCHECDTHGLALLTDAIISIVQVLTSINI